MYALAIQLGGRDPSCQGPVKGGLGRRPTPLNAPRGNMINYEKRKLLPPIDFPAAICLPEEQGESPGKIYIHLTLSASGAILTTGSFLGFSPLPLDSGCTGRFKGSFSLYLRE